MIVYNVTVKVDHDVHTDWLTWMKETHIPDVMRTGMFEENKLCRILSTEEEDGVTYAIQYLCKDMETFQQYQQSFAPALQADHTERYRNHYVAFRTLMEVVE